MKSSNTVNKNPKPEVHKPPKLEKIISENNIVDLKNITLSEFASYQDKIYKNIFLFACRKADTELVSYLAKFLQTHNKLDFIYSTNWDGLTAIDLASEADNPSLIEYLVKQYNIDINKRNNNGYSALTWTIVRNCQKTFNHLLLTGAEFSNIEAEAIAKSTDFLIYFHSKSCRDIIYKSKNLIAILYVIENPNLLSIIENADTATIIASYLSQSEGLGLLPLFSEKWLFSINAVFNKESCTYNQIQEMFQLYSARAAGKSPLSKAIYLTSKPTYIPFLADQINIETDKKDEVGFLVTIPVPYRDAYGRGSDRHPITLIRKYIKAITTLSPNYAYNTLSEDAALDFARKRLRILICLNILDDHFVVKDKTEVIRQKVTKLADEINIQLQQLDYPAWILPAVWGSDKYNGIELYHNVDAINWQNTETDRIRSYLKHVSIRSNHVTQSFPFASMRTFMIESNTGQRMAQELLQLNKRVYYSIGDSDLVSLHPLNKNSSIFNPIYQAIISNTDKELVRLAGAYCFDTRDIISQLLKLEPKLPLILLAKSVLFTHLLRTLDLATRKIMSSIDPALAYFSEANTFISAKTFHKDHFVYQGSSSSPDTYKVPLTKKLTNKHISEPDISQQLTRAIIQPKNWNGSIKTPSMEFITNKEAQLATSSRHDLVIISNKEFKSRSGNKHVQSIHEDELVVQNLPIFLEAQHNTQLTASQLNSRFSEAGYGTSGFHDAIKISPIDGLPFLLYCMAEKPREIIAENKKPSIMSKANIKKNALEIAQTINLPDLKLENNYSELLANIDQISHSPEQLPSQEPANIDYTAFRKVTQKLNVKRKEVIRAFYQLESLLRWAVAMMQKIRTLSEAPNLVKKEKSDTPAELVIYKKKKIQGLKSNTTNIRRQLVSQFDEEEKEAKLLNNSIEISKKLENLSISSHERRMIEAALQASLEDGQAKDIINQRKESLKVCAKKYGYNCVDIVGDGNCFFYAVAHQLNQIGCIGQDIDPDTLRSLVAVEISENKNFYMNFVPAEEQQNYITNLAESYKWVGLTASHAMAKIKNVIIAIIPNDGGKPQILKPHGATDIIVLGNEVNYHFQSLIPQPDLGLAPAKATNELQKIIDETETIASAKLTTEAVTGSIKLRVAPANIINKLQPSFASTNTVFPFFINNNNPTTKDSKLNDKTAMGLHNSNKKS